MRQVKLTVQIKLLPNAGQSAALISTLHTANKAANRLSEMAWDAKEFRRFPMHRLFYRCIRDEFPLSAEIVGLLNGKVANAYKIDRKVQRFFRPTGSIAYSPGVLSFQLAKSTVSIWAIGGRLKGMPFVCGERQRKLLELAKGEADLILRNAKWFLNISIEVPEAEEIKVIDVLGVDFGIVEIAHDSDGASYSGSRLNKVRHRSRALRKKLQRKGTKSAKRLLKKRNRKESRFAADLNHVISKRIVHTAQRTNRAIAIEKLGGILTRVRARKRERTKLHSWAFHQLGEFLAYKSEMAGVPLFRVDPKHTSQRCSQCGHTEKANRKSQAEFCCKKCGFATNADWNGAGNIRLKGLKLLGAGAFNHPNVEAIAYGGNRECSHLQSPRL